MTTHPLSPPTDQPVADTAESMLAADSDQPAAGTARSRPTADLDQPAAGTAQSTPTADTDQSRPTPTPTATPTSVADTEQGVTSPRPSGSAADNSTTSAADTDQLPTTTRATATEPGARLPWGRDPESEQGGPPDGEITPPPAPPVPPPWPSVRTKEGLALRVGDNPHLRLLAGSRRRLYRPTVDRVAAEILRTLDIDGFNRRFRDNEVYRGFAGRGSSKYIDLEPWIRVNVDHYFAFGFDRLPVGTRLLDIGCGSGFFLIVCRHFGLRPLGLDMDGDPLYNEQIEFFGLERVVHTVRPGDFLPDLPGRFDVVTSFMTAFNEYRDWSPWGADEWEAFLPALRAIMSPGGRGLLWLNRNLVTGRYYSDEVSAAIKASPEFRARFFANCLRLDAR